MWDIVLSRKLRYNVLVVAPPSAVERQELTNSTPTNQRHYRIHFVYTPKHTSWLNQVEIDSLSAVAKIYIQTAIDLLGIHQKP